MRGGLLRFLESVRASYWFIPTLMSIAVVLLAALTLWLDRRGTVEWLRDVNFIYLNQPDGARSLLSTIAGSIMTVAGVVFSLTMVTLTLASQQFGPRLLGNFMRDRGNQFVLGIFISTYLYCLLILRTVRSEAESFQPFVPHLSVAVAMLITLVALAALIYFIHHVAASIQVGNVIARINEGIRRHLEREGDVGVFPAGVGDAFTRRPDSDPVTRDFRPVRARRAGYLQTIDGGALLRAARRRNVVIELLLRPGDFVMHAQQVMNVHPSDVPEEVVAELLGAMALGSGRGQGGDLEGMLEQLVELALRAQSPAMNDPLTAIACVDRISDALLELGRSEIPSPERADEEGELRLVVPPFDLVRLSESLFSALRSSVADSVLAAGHCAKRLEQVRRATEHDGLAAVAAAEKDRLLADARAQMSPVDYESLLTHVSA